MFNAKNRSLRGSQFDDVNQLDNKAITDPVFVLGRLHTIVNENVCWKIIYSPIAREITI